MLYNIINQIARYADKPINRIIDNFSFIFAESQPENFKLQNYEFVLITATD